MRKKLTRSSFDMKVEKFHDVLKFQNFWISSKLRGSSLFGKDILLFTVKRNVTRGHKSREKFGKNLQYS